MDERTQAHDPRQRSHLRDWLVIIAFALFIGAPLATQLLGISPAQPISELRPFADPPKIPRTFADIVEWPASFEAWYNDHFGLRAFLVRGFGFLKLIVLKSPPLDAAGIGAAAGETASTIADADALYPMIVIGKDNWLFLGRRQLADYRGLMPFQRPELMLIERMIEDRQDWFRRNGITYLVVLVPDKSTIYPEQLPDHIGRERGRSRLDQLTGHLAMRPDLNVLDLRPVLQKAREHEVIYQETDTHWNDAGAFAGYRAIMDWLSERVKIERVLVREDLEVRRGVSPGGNLVRLLGLEHSFPANDQSLWPTDWERITVSSDIEDNTGGRIPIVTENPAVSGLDAVVFRDSFTTLMIKYLSSSFRRTAYYHYEDFDSDIFRDRKPQVVLEILSESNAALGLSPNPDDMVTTGYQSWSSDQDDLDPEFRERFREAAERKLREMKPAP